MQNALRRQWPLPATDKTANPCYFRICWSSSGCSVGSDFVSVASGCSFVSDFVGVTSGCSVGTDCVGVSSGYWAGKQYETVLWGCTICAANDSVWPAWVICLNEAGCRAESDVTFFQADLLQKMVHNQHPQKHLDWMEKIPVAWKPFMIFVGVAPLGHASLTIDGISYILIVLPGLFCIQAYWHEVINRLKGPNTETSRGWSLSEQWGGKVSITIPLSFA